VDDPPLLYPDVRFFLAHGPEEGEKNEELFFRFDSDEVRAIFSPRYPPVDDFEVLERLDFLDMEQIQK
jgi:hypothetical protein